MLIGEPSGEGDYWGSESPTPYRKRTMLTSEPLLHSLETTTVEQFKNSFAPYMPMLPETVDRLLGSDVGHRGPGERLNMVSALIELGVPIPLHSVTSSNRLVAACMLAALESETEVDATEKAVLEYLRHLGLLPAGTGSVEYGCLEHGVVHVSFFYTDDISELPTWWCIDPEDGTISLF